MTPAWAPIFEGYKPVQRWLVAKQPDVLLMIFNDHVTSFFFDHYSQFALGIGDSYAPADEGGPRRRGTPPADHCDPLDPRMRRGFPQPRRADALRRTSAEISSRCH
jgi:hypothetical protein